MKIYFFSNQLRIVGKAWEVKHQLRKLTRQFGTAPIAQLYNASLPSPSLSAQK